MNPAEGCIGELDIVYKNGRPREGVGMPVDGRGARKNPLFLAGFGLYGILSDLFMVGGTGIEPVTSTV